MPSLILYATLYNANVTSVIKRTPRSGVLLYVLYNRVWEPILQYGYASPTIRFCTGGNYFVVIGALNVAKTNKTIVSYDRKKHILYYLAVRFFIITPDCIDETYTTMGIMSDS